ERGNLNRGPSVPRGSWGREGTPPTIIKQRGAEPRWLCAPFPLPKCPHTRKEKISNSDDEIAAWLGREQAKSKGHSGGVSARVAFETNCRIDPVPLVATLTNTYASRFPDQAASFRKKSSATMR